MDRNKLVEDNLKLVYYMVNKFIKNKNIKSYGFNGYLREDFISEGTLALIRAADSYKENTVSGFANYACKCIYNALNSIIVYGNYDCRKANITYLSLDYDDKQLSESNKNLYHEDYSKAYYDEIIRIVDSFKFKHATFIMLRRSEGYTFKEIGKMLGVSDRCAFDYMKRVGKKLTELGIS